MRAIKRPWRITRGFKDAKMNAVPGYDLRRDRHAIIPEVIDNFVVVDGVVVVGGFGVIAHDDRKVGVPEDGSEDLMPEF